jgi:hypothetical protein
MPDASLVLLELRGAASVRTVVRLLAVSALAPLVSLWPQLGSPFAPAFAAAFLALEPLYNNALQLWPGHFTSYVLLPPPWDEILRAKLIATTVLASGAAAVLVALTSFFQPVPPTPGDIAGCALYFCSVHIPLFATGTLLSRQQSRGRIGFGLDDAAAGSMMMVLLGLMSIPFLIAAQLPAGTIIILAYTLVSAVVVWFFFIPKAARRIQKEIPELWHNMQTSSL